MTLLIAAFTKNHAILASDRRLACEDNSGNVVPREDDACKLIHFNERHLIAYTGPAMLPSESGDRLIKTDLWIVDTLMNGDPNWNLWDSLSNLRRRLKRCISRFKDKRLRYITVVCAGWESFIGSDDFDPCLGVISTYINPSLERVDIKEVDDGTETCLTLRKLYNRQLPFIFSAGQEINNGRMVHLKRKFRRINEKINIQNTAIDYLRDEITFSSQTNKWVGQGVLVSALSKDFSTRGGGFTSLGDSGAGSQFKYYPANGNKYLYRGPHSVVSGANAMINFKVEYPKS